MFGFNLRSAAAVAVVLAATVLAQARPVYFGIGVVENRHRGGMQIVTVVEGGPAWEDGQLRPLDLIKRINGTPVRTRAEMEAVISALKPGTAVRMDLEDRSGTPFWVEITPSKNGVILYRAPQARPMATRSGSRGLAARMASVIGER